VDVCDGDEGKQEEDEKEEEKEWGIADEDRTMAGSSPLYVSPRALTEQARLGLSNCCVVLVVIGMRWEMKDRGKGTQTAFLTVPSTCAKTGY
jgi:hypothetical protein